jgi:NAD+ synthase
LKALVLIKKRDNIIKNIFPDYNSEYKLNLTLPRDLLSKDAYNIFTLNINDHHGNVKSSRINKETLNGIVAATDTKQRTRMMHLYYYAEAR